MSSKVDLWTLLLLLALLIVALLGATQNSQVATASPAGQVLPLLPALTMVLVGL